MTDLIAAAIARLNEMNARDPHLVQVDGQARPRELLQAEHLEAWILKVAPQASDALRIAARCQHLMRFAFPRSDYPEGRVGYLKWRKDLAKKHAHLAQEVLTELGIAPEIRAQVRAINLKEGLKTNPDSQAMEDALCLSFLEHELSEFAFKHPDEKVIEIIQKTWGKMSERGHSLALSLALQGRAKDLVARALGN